MSKELENQGSLFDTSHLAARHDEDPFAVVNRQIELSDVSKPVEEPKGSLGKLGLDGIRKEMDESLDRTADLSGNTFAIAKGKEFEQPKGSGGRAPAPGKPESKEDKDKRKSDLRKLGPAGQRIADKKPPDYFPYNK